MKKLGTKRELIGVVIVLLLAAVGFALFAWYTMRPTDTIGTIATISFGLVLSALIGIVLILDHALAPILGRSTFCGIDVDPD